MPSIAHKAGLRSLSRTGKCAGLAAAFLFIFGCENLETAVANGDTRTISLHHLHTGEDLTITYKRDGRYDEAALQKINWELRDWRREEPVKMDPHLIDLIWEVQRETGSKGPVQVVCGYRAPATNAMLRARSRGVAQFSQHMLGKAMDFFLPDVPLARIREVGLRLQRGGVGFYPTSGSPFVHLDTGNVRHWPRVSREYLAKIFPDGKTVHIPADGHPMPGYQQALAEIQARGEEVPSIAVASAGESSTMASKDAVTRFFSKLFGKKDENGDDEEGEITTIQARPVQTAAVKTAEIKTAAAEPEPQSTRAVPLPRARPATAIAAAQQPAPKPQQVASLDDRAAFPAEITGGAHEGHEGIALGYAASDSIFFPRTNPVLSLRPAPQAAKPEPAPRRAVVPVPDSDTSNIGSVSTAETDADAAHAPSCLLDSRLIQFASEQMRQQDPSIAMELAAPTRMTVGGRFSIVPEQPALSRFAGPAVVPLPVEFFGQSASIEPHRTSRAD